MISNSHHTICVTDAPGELLEFLQTVLGLPIAADFPLTARRRPTSSIGRSRTTRGPRAGCSGPARVGWSR